jgi:hypothetical protein
MQTPRLPLFYKASCMFPCKDRSIIGPIAHPLDTHHPTKMP